jgi:DNA-binding response OmpR family regulator
MKRIILVEDDAPIRDIFQLAFAANDYEFVALTNGEKIINNEIDTPNLFILDRNISGTDGLEVCLYIKNSTALKDIPVIMLSADPDMKWLAKDAGADNFISKPFSLKKLRETVGNTLKH